MTNLGEGGEGEVAQSCPTLCDPVDCSLPGFSIHGIFQTRVLEWGAIAFSNKGLLYSIGNFSQYSVMTHMEKESKKQWTYIYV